MTGAFATDAHSLEWQKLWQKQIPWEGRTWVGATSSIIVANRAWIMTRERIPGTINLSGTTWPTDNGSRWAWLRRGARFSFPSRLGDGDVRHCEIRRGPLSTSRVVFASQAGPDCWTCLLRLCVHARLCYRRVLRAVAMTISSLMPAGTRERDECDLTVTNGIDDDSYRENGSWSSYHKATA